MFSNQGSFSAPRTNKSKDHLLSPMREKVISLKLIGLFVLNVVEGMMASFLWPRVISIIVERVVIWRMISLWWRHKEGKNAHGQERSPNPYVPKENWFYSFQSPKVISIILERVVIGMLILFSFDVYALFDPGATLSFGTPLIATKFDIMPDILYDPLSVSTLVDNSAVVRRMYKGCPIS